MDKIALSRSGLILKLSQNWSKISTVLKEMGNEAIVDYLAKDQFWGATKNTDGLLVGANALGRWLMDIRGKYVSNFNQLECIQPLGLTGFMQFGYEIETI